MKRVLPLFLFVMMATLALMPATGAGSSSRADRPPGVAASSWVPITPGFGAVIERQLPERYSGGRPLPSSLGYFVVWRAGQWLRLDSLLIHSRVLRSPPAASKSIALHGNLRFAVERQVTGQPMRNQPPTPAALGYFLIKRGGQWLRLAPNPQGALFRGPLRPPSTADWLPISKSLRFVVEQRTPERDAGAGQLPSVLGYFISERDGSWIRLDSIA
jgi:hypothetical protein